MERKTQECRAKHLNFNVFQRKQGKYRQGPQRTFLGQLSREKAFLLFKKYERNI